MLDVDGDHHAAASALTEAVARAEDDRLRSPFLEVPAALRALRRRADPPPAVTRDALWELAVRMHPLLQAQAGLLEPLTERELEVLAHLPGRAKNREIAADLYVSLNTLKTHLSSIYRKLGVTERNQAVACATELGLIIPDSCRHPSIRSDWIGAWSRYNPV